MATMRWARPRERALSQGEIDAQMRRFRGEPPG
jgi:hypothetical protein